MIKGFKQCLEKKREVINKITGESWDGWMDAATRPSEIIGDKRPHKYYLCAVLVPKYGGTFSRRCMIIEYDWYAEKWMCGDVIVTHWRHCPELPKKERQ